VLKKIFGSKCKEWTGDKRQAGRQLHNEEFLLFYSTTNIIQVIQSRKIRWMEHLACVRERRDTYSVLVGKPE
jgi:hypothetical protein